MKLYWLYLLFFVLEYPKVFGASFADREDIQRVDITEGETLSLTCKAKPTLLRSYRWVYMREGVRKPRVLSSGRRLVVGEPRLSIEAQPGDGFVNLVLKIQEIRPYEAGLFMCWRQGLKPDPQVYVRVLADGAEEAEPISVEVSAPSHVKYGGAVTIKCQINPSWPGKVFWNKNGKPISQSDKQYSQKVEENERQELIASLDVSSVRESANYTCQVPSTPPTEASFFLTVKVAKIESLTTEPHKDTVEYGSSFKISCEASDAESEILWLKDGANLGMKQGASKVTLNGKVKSELHFESFSRDNNGQYVCYVPGDSKSVVINIEGRPPKIIGVKGWDFIVGDVLNLICSTQYNKKKKDVTWLFEGHPLRPDWFGEASYREDTNNVTHHDLRLPIPTSKHTGTYTCTAPFGSASTYVREIVPPYIDESAAELTEVHEGETVTLPCSVIGYPVPFIIWEKFIDNDWKILEDSEFEVEGMELKKKAVTEKRPQGDEKVGEKSVLFLKDVKDLHGGRYRCRGSNQQQEAIAEAQVVINGPLPMILNLTSEAVEEGQDLVILCVVKNLQEPVQFVKGFKVLGQGSDQRHAVHLLLKDPAEGRQVKSEEGIQTYSLTIKNAELEDADTYECLAGSDLSLTVKAAVQVAPPTIVEVAASPAVEGSEFFVSCTFKNLYTDEREVVFYFDGKNLNEANEPRYSVHLAELKGESIVYSRPRAKLATYVLKVGKSTPADSGQYRCILGEDVVGSALVAVEALENIEEVHLAALPAWVGGELKLRCSVTNWDKEVSFLQNTTMLLEEEDPRYYLSRKVEGNETVHSLTIFDVTLQDSGFYQCFTSPLTSADVNVTIRSLENLQISLEHLPKSSLVWTKSEMILDCSVHGFLDYMHTIELSHNGRPYLYVDTSEKGAQVNPRVTFIRGSDNNSKGSHLSYKIKVRQVEERDAGSWVCRATVPEAAVVLEDTIVISIFKPPSFVKIPEKEVILEEDVVLELLCQAEGYPQPQVLWYKETQDQPLVNETESAKLEISSFSEEDAGIYRCDATSLNETVSFETKLMLKLRATTTEFIPITYFQEDNLKIIEMPKKEVFVPENSPIDLKCVADGASPPFVTWFKKDIGEEEVLASGYNYVIYTIEDFKESDAGEYICKAMITKVSETSDITKLILVKGIMTDDLSAAASTSLPLLTSTLEPAAIFTLPSSIPTLMAEKLIFVKGPARVKVGSDLSLMCLVSPMLANFKYLIMLNDVILTLDKALVTSDRRMRIINGVGPLGETIVGLTIQDAQESDSGEYKCTANTDPVAAHSQYLEVVTADKFTEPNEPSSTPALIKVPNVTESSVSLGAEDFWDTTSRFIFVARSTTTMPESTTVIPTEEETTLPEDPFEDQFLHKDVKGPSSDEDQKKAAVGQNVSFTCTSYISDPNIDAKYFWYFETPERLLFADSDRLSPDQRYHVQKNNFLDEFTSTLTISKVLTTDAGIYGCSLGHSRNFTYEHRLKVLDVETPDYEVPHQFAEGETDGKDGHDYLSKSEEEYDEGGLLVDIDDDKEREKTSNERVDLSEQIKEKVKPFFIDNDKMIDQSVTEERTKLDTPTSVVVPTSTEVSRNTRVFSTIIDLISPNDLITVFPTPELPRTTDTVPAKKVKINSTERNNIEDSDDAAIQHILDEIVVITADYEDLQDMFPTDAPQTTPFEDSTEISSTEVSIFEENAEKEITTGKTTHDEEIDKYYDEGLQNNATDEGTYFNEETTITFQLPPQQTLIVAVPGEDVRSPAGTEVILPCPTKAIPEDITWKDNEHLLFLGSLDLAGVEGLALSPDGHLRLLSQVAKTKNSKTYTCLVFDYNTYEDVPVMSYFVELTVGDPTIAPELKVATTTYQPPTSTYEFPGLEWQEVAVIANSELAGKSLVKVLQDGGLNVKLASADVCAKSVNINGWDQAQRNLEECVNGSRLANIIRSGQSLFVILDFTVQLPSEKRYGSTLISVHNVAMDIKSHVYGPLIPMSEDERDILVECGSPVYSSQNLGLDMADICKNSVASTILSLQEAYLSQSRKHPMV